jgi:hypothetical protein
MMRHSDIPYANYAIRDMLRPGSGAAAFWDAIRAMGGPAWEPKEALAGGGRLEER